MWVQVVNKKGVPVDSNMIQEKSKSPDDNLWQKEDGRI